MESIAHPALWGGKGAWATADAGEVRWDGRPLTSEARRRIGYMPEERAPYPKMKVAEQLVYLARLRGPPRNAVPRTGTRIKLSDAWRAA